METPTNLTPVTLIQAVVVQLQDLPQESIQEVLNFAEFLKKTQSSTQPKRGSAEALLTCAGTWVFDEGEREALEKEIQAMREFIDE